MPKTVEWDGVSATYEDEELLAMAALKGAGEVETLRFIHEWKSIDPQARLTDAPVNSSELGAQRPYSLLPTANEPTPNEKRGPRRRRHEPLDGQVSLLD